MSTPMPVLPQAKTAAKSLVPESAPSPVAAPVTAQAPAPKDGYVAVGPSANLSLVLGGKSGAEPAPADAKSPVEKASLKYAQAKAEIVRTEGEVKRKFSMMREAKWQVQVKGKGATDADRVAARKAEDEYAAALRDRELANAHMYVAGSEFAIAYKKDAVEAERAKITKIKTLKFDNDGPEKKQLMDADVLESEKKIQEGEAYIKAEQAQLEKYRKDVETLTGKASK